MKEAKLYKKLANSQVQCQLCNHFCHFIDGRLGVCGVRQNIKGVVYSLNYGCLITEAVDPIEKKPLFHFLPGTTTYSIATVGCNLRCDNCQNWQISQASKPKTEDRKSIAIQLPGYNVTAEEVVNKAIKSGCKSISYTYTEPTIFFEFTLDCMKLANQKGLKNVWVTNGYMSKQCLDEILPYLDAINVDLKFFDDKIYQKNCGCQLQPILDNLKYFCQKPKLMLEITTLLIPGLIETGNQLRKITEFISQELSVNVPWHISKFSPEISHKLIGAKETSDKLIDEAYQSGIMAGLNFVYVGNVLGDKRENTYCPECENLVIERCGYSVRRFDKYGKCAKCGNTLNIKIQGSSINEV